MTWSIIAKAVSTLTVSTLGTVTEGMEVLHTSARATHAVAKVAELEANALLERSEVSVKISQSERMEELRQLQAKIKATKLEEKTKAAK